MDVIATKLEGRTGPSPKDWMEDWVLDTPTEVERSSRFQSFQEVCAKADIMLKALEGEIGNLRLRSPKGDDSPDAKYYNALYRILCEDQTKRLSWILKRLKCTKFVFAFDECSNLNFCKVNRSVSLDMSLIALQRIIKAGDQHDYHGVTIWYLLLDTTPSILDLTPVGLEATSSRLTDNLRPLPIWPYIGFNQMIDRTKAPEIQTAADVLSLKHLKIYGRPVSGGTCCSLHLSLYNIRHSTGLALETKR